MIKQTLVLAAVAAFCGAMTVHAEDSVNEMQKSVRDAGNQMSKDAQQSADEAKAKANDTTDNAHRDVSSEKAKLKS